MSDTHLFPRAIAAALLAGVLTVSACTAPGSALIGQPSGADAPPIGNEAWPVASDWQDPDQLEAVASDLVATYLALTDTITRDGGRGSDRMATVTSAAWFVVEENAFAYYRTERLRTLGSTSFDSLVVQSSWLDPEGAITLDLVVCVDARWVWLIGQDTPDPPEGLFDWLIGEVEGDVVDDDEWDEWQEYLDNYPPQAGAREAVVFWLVGPRLDRLVVDGSANWEGAHRCHVNEWQ
jgi:hypothetical protein